MRTLRLTGLIVFFAAVFLTFVGSNQLISDRTLDEEGPAKEMTVGEPINAAVPTDGTAQSTAIAVNNTLETAAEATGRSGKGAKSKSRSFRSSSAESAVWRDHKGGKWVVETNWDGEKWVTKRVYYPNNEP